ncbi:hypothetical protein AQUCO_00700625v1 [Aquilegia coerulea]|uniref:TF-B3 domain-containing protein n=1 Tax=Aquilegia coerulea TaxID=218851 RepID=A0A2G5EKZ1_AQUCA|nr:hypothetical protein AQUCO_00700625v1 [Aquilegia coerulea]
MAVIEISAEEFGMQTSAAEEKKKKTSYEEDVLALAQFSYFRNYYNPTSSPKPISMEGFHQVKIDTSLSYKQKHTLPDHDKANQSAKERAEEVQANLDPEFPSFVKVMLPSHVSGGFWMGFPAKFCSSHLPKEDVMMTLVDENQEEFLARFLPRKTGLSSGWKGFSIAHKLVEGDVLVFHLIKDTKFQVYILRAYGLGGIDGVVGLLSLDSHPKCTRQNNAGQRVMTTEETAIKCQKTSLMAAAFPPSEEEETESSSAEVGSEGLEGIMFSKMDEVQPHTPCKETNSTGVRRSSRVSTKTKVWFDYMGLKRYSTKKKSYKQHTTERVEQFQSNGESRLASNLKTSRDDFMAWDNSLEALEKRGLNVGFLRARVQQCMEIKAEAATDLKMCGELRVEQARLKAELAELERKSKTLDSNLKIYEAKSKVNEDRFRSVVNSPW